MCFLFISLVLIRDLPPSRWEEGIPPFPLGFPPERGRKKKKEFKKNLVSIFIDSRLLEGKNARFF